MIACISGSISSRLDSFRFRRSFMRGSCRFFCWSLLYCSGLRYSPLLIPTDIFCMDAQQIAAVFANRKVEEVGPCPWTYPILDETYEEAKSRFGKPNLPVVSEPISYDATGKEIVVVSDLHIASGRTAVGVFRGTENFFADDAFGRFLDHVQSIKETRSMLLVFNGDIFDFLRVTEYPGWRKR